MEIKHILVEVIKVKQLVRFGYAQRATENRLLKELLDFNHLGHRRGGTPRRSCRESINNEV